MVRRGRELSSAFNGMQNLVKQDPDRARQNSQKQQQEQNSSEYVLLSGAAALRTRTFRCVISHTDMVDIAKKVMAC